MRQIARKQFFKLKNYRVEQPPDRKQLASATMENLTGTVAASSLGTV